MRAAHDRGDAGGGRVPRALGCGGAARAWRRGRRGGRRARRGGVPASDVAGRGSAAAHARARREPRPRADGRWSALDGRRLYAQARAASFVYQAVLRGELTRTLGVEWSPVRKGIAEVVGVRRARCWSGSAGGGRRSRPRWPSAGPRARGRRRRRRSRPAAPKSGTPSLDELVREWRARAAELGLGRDELALIVGRARSVAIDEAGWRARVPAARGAARAHASHGDVHARARSSRRICEQLPAGAPRRRGGDRGGRGSLPRLRAGGRAGPDGEAREGDQGFRRRDGRIVPVDRRAAALLDAGAARARAAADRSRARLARRRGRAGRPSARSPARSPRGRRCRPSSARWSSGSVATATASRWSPAGPGPARRSRSPQHARRGRRPVIRCSGSRPRAAPRRELRDGAGIQSTSTFALLADLRGGAPAAAAVRARRRRGRHGPDARDRRARSSTSGRSSGKLVLVGDHRQLPELQAGGVFRALVARGLAIELTRERPPGPRLGAPRARPAPRRPTPSQALAAYAEHDRLHRRRDRRCGARAARRRLGCRRRPGRGGDDRPATRRRRRPQRPGARAPARRGSARARARDAGRHRSRSATSSWSSATTPGASVNNGDRGRVTAIDPDAGRDRDRAARPAGPARSPLPRRADRRRRPVARARLRDHRPHRPGPDRRPRLRARRRGHRPRVGLRRPQPRPPQQPPLPRRRASTTTAPSTRRPGRRRPTRSSASLASSSPAARRSSRSTPAGKPSPTRSALPRKRSSEPPTSDAGSKPAASAGSPDGAASSRPPANARPTRAAPASKPHTPRGPSTPNRTSPPASNALTPARPSERPNASCGTTAGSDESCER